MSKDKVKASWDLRTIKVFIDLCVELVEQGERKGTSLTKKGWAILAENFTSKTGRAYSKPQFKNKYNSLRKEWQTWDRLLRETGMGWDAEKQNVSAPDDWWKKKLMEVPTYEKFKERGLQFQEELTTLFGPMAVTGPHSWAPSSMTLPSDAAANDDMEEGSEDNEEMLAASTGISNEFNSVTFNDASGGSRGNFEGREETTHGGRTGGRGRPSSSLRLKKRTEVMKKKPAAAMKIADALSRIAAANDIDSQRVNEVVSQGHAKRQEEEAKAYEMLIAGVMEHLNEVHEIVEDPELFGRCTKLLMREPVVREMYVALKNNRDKLVIFLTHASRP